MNCPIDGNKLQMSERQGIEIDYCPQCRGVWLDKGELDKMIERGAQTSTSSYDEHDEEREEQSRNRNGRRKEGFLGDLFDF